MYLSHDRKSVVTCLNFHRRKSAINIIPLTVIEILGFLGQEMESANGDLWGSFYDVPSGSFQEIVVDSPLVASIARLDPVDVILEKYNDTCLLHPEVKRLELIRNEWAVRCGHVAFLLYTTTTSSPISGITPSASTPRNTFFSIACAYGHLEFVEYFLQHPTSKESASYFQQAILRAAANGHFHVVKRLAPLFDASKSILQRIIGYVVADDDVKTFDFLYHFADHYAKQLQSLAEHCVSVAAKHNKITMLSHLLNLFRINVVSVVKPFTVAVRNGHVETVRMLLKLFPSILTTPGEDNKKGYMGNALGPPLPLATSYGHTELVKLMIQAYPQTAHQVCDRGEPLLHIAVWNGDVETTKVLLELEPSLTKSRNLGGETALLIAARKGNMEMFDMLYNCDPDMLGESTNVGNTVLMAACSYGYLNLAQRIYKCDPSLVTRINRDGWNCLHIACYKGYSDIALWLLGVVPKQMVFAIISISYVSTSYEDTSTLILAARIGNVEIVKSLLTAYPELIHLKTSDGITAFMYACEYGHMEVIQFILDYFDFPSSSSGREVMTATSDNGHTALTYACVGRRGAVVSYLIDRLGGDPTQVKPYLTDVGFTKIRDEFHVICGCGDFCLSIVKMMVALDPSLLQPNKGSTPLHYAVGQSCYQIAEFLITHNPALAKATDSGTKAIPLYEAAQRNDKRMIQLLYP
eukprot:PhF_6_TR10378/c0_g2_i1/m.16157